MSYLRRLHFESRVQAVATANALGGAFNASSGATGGSNRIPPEAMIAMMTGGF
jgi:hypothetical protein